MLVPLLHILHPFHSDLLLSVVAEREVILLLLAEVDPQLILSLGQLQLLSALDPLALPLALASCLLQPHANSCELVVDLRPDVFLVVGWVVLPDLDVSSCFGGHGKQDFRVVMLFVAEFMGDISVIGLDAVYDQSGEDEALLKG